MAVGDFTVALNASVKVRFQQIECHLIEELKKINVVWATFQRLDDFGFFFAFKSHPSHKATVFSFIFKEVAGLPLASEQIFS